MLQKMFLNDKPLHLSENDLPCLISYPEKTGGSQFSVSLIADMFLRGEKILFLTAYPMATENFLRQVDGTDRTIKHVKEERDINTSLDAAVIMIKSGDESLFMKTIAALQDAKDRVVFVKNMEVFSDQTIRAVLPSNKIVLSGHLDECRLKKEIAGKFYASTIFFAKPETGSFAVPKLEKYTGHFKSQTTEGVVKVEMK